MTISTTAPRVILNCDGATTSFPIAIQAYLATDFTVMLTAPVSAGGAQSILTLNSDYTLAQSGTLQPPQWSLTTIGASSPRPAGYSIQVFLNPTASQQSQYVQGQTFPSATVQQNLDRLTQMVQRALDLASRAVHTPDGDVSPGTTLPVQALRASMYLATDANGNLIATAALPGTANTQASLGPVIYPQSPAEVTAGVVPTAYIFPTLNVRRYGAALNAVWNGTNATGTDDTAAFQAAVNVASAMGGGEVTFDGPTICGTSVPIQWKANVWLRGIGNPTIYINSSTTGGAFPNLNGCVPLQALGVVGAGQTVTNTPSPTNNVCNVASTAGFTVGAWVILQTTGTVIGALGLNSSLGDFIYYDGAHATYPQSNGRKQQFFRVAAINPGVSVTLSTFPRESYPTATLAPMSTPMNNIIWRDFTIRNSINASSFGGCSSMMFVTDFKVLNVFHYGFYGYPGLRMVTCAYGEVASNNYRDGQGNGPGASTGISLDTIEGCHDVWSHHNVHDTYTEDEYAMRANNCQCTDNSYRNAYDSAVNTHGNGCFSIQFARNKATDMQNTGLSVGYSANRAPDFDIQMESNVFRNCGGKAISTGSSSGLTSLVGGAGYTNGTYTGVPLTGGSGAGAQATITVAGGAVTSVLVTKLGSGYLFMDSVSASNANLGGAGAGFSIQALGALVGGAGYVSATYNNVPLTGGSGAGAQATIIVTGGAVTAVVITARGAGYNASTDVCSASNANLGGSGAGFSIALGPLGGPHQRIKLLDNVINGVKLSSGSTTAAISPQFLMDSEITLNKIDGTTVGNAPDAGISCVSCVRTSVSHNKVSNFTGGFGLQFTSCTDYNADFNTLFNNANQCNTASSAASVAGSVQLRGNVSNTNNSSIEGGNLVRSWGNSWDMNPQQASLLYSNLASVTPDCNQGTVHIVEQTSVLTVAINNPLNPPSAFLPQGTGRLTIVVRNRTGGALTAANFGTLYKISAFVLPLNGFSRSVDVEWDPGFAYWREVSRTPADVPN